MRFLTGRAMVRALSLCVALMLPVGDVAAQTTLKVLDWNTQHGVGSDGVYDIRRIAAWIVKTGANVVSLNEVERFSGAWGNEDQPARYAALLRASTGKAWYASFAQRDGGAIGQGNLLLSTFPFESEDAHTLSYSRSVARVQILVNGIRVNVFSTHLDADSSLRRSAQMRELHAWAASFPQQHIFAGDFNAWPGAAEIGNMTAVARDAWADARTNGLSVSYSGNEAGNTRTSRIDYIWYSKQATGLVLKAAEVFDVRDGNGVTPSDHRPVMATFQVGAGASAIPVVTIDAPVQGAVISKQPFTVSGWAVDLAAGGGTGIDAIHVYAHPKNGAAAIFLGVANIGISRPDVAAAFGRPSFATAGFGLPASGLPPGEYELAVYGRSVISRTFSAVRTTPVVVPNTLAVFVDTAQSGAAAGNRTRVAGWALERGAAAGAGVDAVHVHATPSGRWAPIFLGAAAVAGDRNDVAAAMGAQFRYSGYSLDAAPLPRGSWTILVFVRSTVSKTFTLSAVIPVTVSAP